MEIRYEKAVIRQSVGGVETETEVMLPNFGDRRKRSRSAYGGKGDCGISAITGKSLYIDLLTSGKLNGYLAELNEEAESLFPRLVNQLAEKEKVTEELKAVDEMKWVRLMNNISNRARKL